MSNPIIAINISKVANRPEALQPCTRWGQKMHNHRDASWFFGVLSSSSRSASFPWPADMAGAPLTCGKP